MLPGLPRGEFVAEAARLDRLRAIAPIVATVTAGETDAVALQATVACLLWGVFSHANWCGFYRRVADRELAVGPYQGAMGCLRISFDRGVCGAAARTGETQLVRDVYEFPGHIACDARSRSEIVVPVFAGGELRAVLDIDSPHLDAFSGAEADVLVDLMRATFDRADVRW